MMSCRAREVAVESSRSPPGLMSRWDVPGRWLGSRIMQRLDRQPRPSVRDLSGLPNRGGREEDLEGEVPSGGHRARRGAPDRHGLQPSGERRPGGPGDQDRQDRRDRAAHRPAVRARPRHQELGRPRNQASEREEDRSRIQPRPGGRGRHPPPGANAPNKLASGPQVAGVIGTLNSSVAQSVAPVLAKANIAQISPANTNDTLTRGPNFKDAPKRIWPTYFRVASLDSLQGPFGADYALSKGGYKSAFVINDKKTYGQGLATAWADRLKEKGGQVVGTDTVNPGDRDFGAVVTKVIAAKPDMVFYGGEYPEAGPLAAQLKDRGFTGPLMGGDGIYSSDFFKGAGDKGDGSLATSLGQPTARLDSAKQFVADYQAAGYKESYSAYGALSFDAANILIQGLAKALPNASDVQSARPEIVKAVAETRGYQGVTGEHSFDEFGDTSNRAWTVYKAGNK